MVMAMPIRAALTEEVRHGAEDRNHTSLASTLVPFKKDTRRVVITCMVNV
jgi:hypothetical protein